MLRSIDSEVHYWYSHLRERIEEHSDIHKVSAPISLAGTLLGMYGVGHWFGEWGVVLYPVVTYADLCVNVMGLKGTRYTLEANVPSFDEFLVMLSKPLRLPFLFFGLNVAIPSAMEKGFDDPLALLGTGLVLSSASMYLTDTDKPVKASYIKNMYERIKGTILPAYQPTLPSKILQNINSLFTYINL